MCLVRLFLPNDEEVIFNKSSILIPQTINTIHSLFSFRLSTKDCLLWEIYDHINTQSLTPRREIGRLIVKEVGLKAPLEK